MTNKQTPQTQGIESLILSGRGLRVMKDSDLAAVYGVQLKRLNQQVQRNIKRFPADFAFQVTRQEFAALKSQSVMSKSVSGHEEAIQDLFEAIRQLIEPAVEKKRKEIGFHIRKTAPPYKVRVHKRF